MWTTPRTQGMQEDCCEFEVNPYMLQYKQQCERNNNKKAQETGWEVRQLQLECS